MHYKFRRAVTKWREYGPLVLAKKSVLYIPIEIDNLFYRLRQGSPTKVMAEDWDTLIILDACRFDMFEERNDIPGELEHRYSLGSTSEEFLERNFRNGTFHDTVYVNTNPYVPHLGLDVGTFHAVVDLLDEWDEEIQTVRPDVVARAAIDAHREYPRKRLIVHFMQPHIPFIGEIGQSLDVGGWSPDGEDTSIEGRTIWQVLRDNPSGSAEGLNLEVVWEAYNENLDIVLEHVRWLIGKLGGMSVVTSDHGNMVGERLRPIPTGRMFGHPLGVYHPSLVKVPWLRVGSGKRRVVVAEETEPNEDAERDDVEKRLRELGYR